ncbi:uncharacterized protein LOC112348838 [Selaginella moellendorffii]|uniref:uncharacterized protein LOC112348838 n=1 Tax=Selaginella moellendorffii TaxID=88036 RepID=UPI000D1CD4FA|nr:uncharacterized protein LOC112348838 [Selaginella moellendorffii]|eukprot:XP_024537841.1 uncharacterized protein LOC112348838 [Selaginella moellendorffii]
MEVDFGEEAGTTEVFQQSHGGIKDRDLEPKVSPDSRVHAVFLGDDNDPVFIATSLASTNAAKLLDLLHYFKDVFAWDYSQLLGVPMDTIMHSIMLSKSAKPVCQKMWHFSPAAHSKMKLEIERLVAVGFIYPLESSEWVANLVPAHKRFMTHAFHDLIGGALRVYMDDLCTTSDSFKDHFVHLEQIFTRYRQHRFSLNPAKCKFGVTEGQLLGFDVS